MISLKYQKYKNLTMPLNLYNHFNSKDKYEKDFNSSIYNQCTSLSLEDNTKLNIQTSILRKILGKGLEKE